MPTALVILLLVSPAPGGIPPLTPDERGLLQTARDGAYDHQEPAFAALAAHTATWTGEVGDAPIRLVPDLPAMRDDPQTHRGDLCLIEGRIEAIERLQPPWEMFDAWFVRNETGEPVLVYVNFGAAGAGGVGDAAGAERSTFRPRQRVRLAARFLKRFEATLDGPGQTGQVRAYATFVGAQPRRIGAGAAAGAGWVLPAMAGSVGAAGLVVVLLLYATRRAARGDRERHRRVVALVDEAEEPIDLPPDPAEALSVLRRHAESNHLGARHATQERAT